MHFKTYRLYVDGLREFDLSDASAVVDKATSEAFYGKYYYTIHSEIVDHRFLWISVDYDDALSFRSYVVDLRDGSRQDNPRQKTQIEPRQQFFACYDTDTKYLYLSDINRRSFLNQYLSESLGKGIQIINVYSSVDEFCQRIRTIREFKFSQVDNLLARTSGSLFTEVGNVMGLDIPESLQIKIGYNNLPVHQARPLIDRLMRERDQFESVVVIGCDDNDVEHSFDFSSILKSIPISAVKDENEHFDPEEIKRELLKYLRSPQNV